MTVFITSCLDNILDLALYYHSRSSLDLSLGREIDGLVSLAYIPRLGSKNIDNSYKSKYIQRSGSSIIYVVPDHVC